MNSSASITSPCDAVQVPFITYMWPSMGKGGLDKFSKIRFQLFCNHYTFILQIMCIWVVIAILVIKYSMLKSLPVNVRINKNPKWHVFSDNAYDITCNTGKSIQKLKVTWCSALAMYLNWTMHVQHDNTGRSNAVKSCYAAQLGMTCRCMNVVLNTCCWQIKFEVLRITQCDD